jgi:hypothetical protein
MTFTNADAISLSDKLGALTLTEGELAVLAHLLERAGTDEVSGFATSGFHDTIGILSAVSKLTPPLTGDDNWVKGGNEPRR